MLGFQPAQVLRAHLPPKPNITTTTQHAASGGRPSPTSSSGLPRRSPTSVSFDAIIVPFTPHSTHPPCSCPQIHAPPPPLNPSPPPSHPLITPPPPPPQTPATPKGILELFFTQVSEGMRALGASFYLLSVAIGTYLAGALNLIVASIFPNDLWVAGGLPTPSGGWGLGWGGGWRLGWGCVWMWVVGGIGGAGGGSWCLTGNAAAFTRHASQTIPSLATTIG